MDFLIKAARATAILPGAPAGRATRWTGGILRPSGSAGWRAGRSDDCFIGFLGTTD